MSQIIIGDATKINQMQFNQKFGVIVADPPWRYRQGETGSLQGRARSHYQTMSDEDIYSMPIHSLAKDDSVLFLWGTWPKNREAQKTVERWGFEYITGYPWIKLNKNGHGVYYGVGYWVRGCSEYVLIGKRGNVSPPRLKGYLGLMSPNFGHSKKPDDVHDIAESLPGPYLELFARRSRDGWVSFGNEVEDVTTGVVHTIDGNIIPEQSRLF